MTIIDFFTYCYGRLRCRHLHYSILSFPRYLIRRLANKYIPLYLNKQNKQSGIIIDGLVVSFTSFPARINDAWQVVECMFRQTYLPEKVILWLSKDQFASNNDLPESLLCRVNNRFEINLVDGDIRSHKKYYYVMKQYPDKYIFLIDDDIYYPTTLIEKSWEAHIKNPKAIICNFGSEIKYDSNGKLKPYKEWETKNNCYENIFFGSGGGTLIKVEQLYKDVIDIDLALKLTPLADDIWLNAMANLAGTPKLLIQNRQILPILIDNDSKLASQNRVSGENNNQLKAVIEYYITHMGVDPFKKR